MLSKYISISPAKLVLALVLVVVMVCISGGSSFLAAPQQADAPPQLVGSPLGSAKDLASPMARSFSSEQDVTPDHSAVKDSAYLTLPESPDAAPVPPRPPAEDSQLIIVNPSPIDPMPVVEYQAAAPLSGFVYSSEIPLSRELQEFAYLRSVEKNIEYPVLLALMWRESRFNPTAVGYNTNGTRDHGIMQINDVNHGWLRAEVGITNYMDPVQNITAGTELLGRMTALYGQHYGLLAYQYGEGGMSSRVSAGQTTSSQTEQLYSKAADFQAVLDRAPQAI